MSSTAKAATSLPLPTTLNGTTVKVRDANGQERAAPLLFVSPTQVNYQIPPGTAPGTATVTITSTEVAVASEIIAVTAVAPGLFSADSSGKGWAAATIQRVKNGVSSYEQTLRYDAAQHQFTPLPIDLSAPDEEVYLLLYGTGTRYRTSLANVKVQIDGQNLPVTFANAQGQFAGVDQINVLLPRMLSGRGEINLTVVADGKAANTVKVKVK